MTISKLERFGISHKMAKLIRLAIIPLIIGNLAPFLSKIFPAKADIIASATAPGKVIHPANETEP